MKRGCSIGPLQPPLQARAQLPLSSGANRGYSYALENQFPRHGPLLQNNCYSLVVKISVMSEPSLMVRLMLYRSWLGHFSCKKKKKKSPQSETQIRCFSGGIWSCTDFLCYLDDPSLYRHFSFHGLKLVEATNEWLGVQSQVMLPKYTNDRGQGLSSF